MSDEHDDKKHDTGKELAAVREELHETSSIVTNLRDEARAMRRNDKRRARDIENRTTPPIVSASESTDKMIRGIAKEVVVDELPKHQLACMGPGGGLHTLSDEFAKMRTTVNRWAGALTLVCVLLPVGIAAWTSRTADMRAQESLKKTIEAASDVAKQLKAVQDAAKGSHGELDQPPPACQFSQVSK